LGPTLLHADRHDETYRRLKRQEIKKTLALEHKVITAKVFNETGTRGSRKAALSSLKLYVPGTRRNGAVFHFVTVQNSWFIFLKNPTFYTKIHFKTFTH